MTISSEITQAVFVGNGSATSFAFGNRVFSASDLAIYLDSVLQTGGYQVEDLDTAQANVVFDVAPLLDVEILIESIIPIQQLTSFRNQQRFNAEVHEDEFDRTNLRILKVAADLVQAVQIRPGEEATPENTLVPDLATRIAAFFIWDNDGNIIAVKVADLLEYIGGTKIGAGEGLYDTFDSGENLTTLHVGEGTGITANADTVQIHQDYLDLINNSIQTINDGAGFIYGRVGQDVTLDIGAGSGITVNANDVQISADKLTILDNADYSNVGKNNQVLLPTDFNDLTRSGMFYMDAGALNNPNAADGCLLVIGADPINTGQMFVQTEASGDYVRIFYRNQLAGVWGGWEQTVTTGNVLLVLNASYISFVDDPEGVYDNVQDALAAALDAITTRYDPATTILTATNVQGAIEEIVSVLEFITSGVQFEGVWNATANTPPIDTFTPNSGDFYIVSVAGTTDLSNPPGTPDPAGDPLNDWQVGDLAIYDAVAGDNGYIGWSRRPILGIITHAASTVFDDVNYVLSFPSDLSPPQFVQPALDKVWPFAKQTLDSNVGRPAYTGLTDYANLLSAQFNTSNDAAVGHPATAEKISIVSGLTDTLDTFGVLAITATGGNARAFFNTVQIGVLGDWQEAYLLTGPRTKANVDLILDNSDAGNIGKQGQTAILDADLIIINGFSSCIDTTLNIAAAESGSLLTTMWQNGGAGTQTFITLTNPPRIFNRYSGSGIWNNWIEVFASETRTSAQANTILDNAEAGNIGKLSVSGETIEPNAGKGGFYSATSTTPNNPSSGSVAIFQSGYNTNRIHALYGDVVSNRLWHKGGGTDTTVSNEIFSSATRTSAQANTILSNAEAGNIGKNAISGQVDGDLISIAGFSRVLSPFDNSPNGNATSVITGVYDINSMFAIYHPTAGGVYWRKKLGGVWDAAFNEFFYSSTRTSAQANDSLDLADTATQSADLAAYLPRDGSQPMTSNLEIGDSTIGSNTVRFNSLLGSWSIGTSGVEDGSFLLYNTLLGNSVFTIAPDSIVPFFNGATQARGDVTAFLGGVTSNPAIAATGLTNAYDLIESLINKIEELETRLANAGIA